MSKLSSLILSLKNKGFRSTLKVVYNGYCVVNKFIVFYLNLERVQEKEAIDPAISIQQMSLDKLESLRSNCKDLPPDFYCDKIYNFKTPCVALVRGELAAILWIVSPQEHSRFLCLNKGDVEYNYSFVLPEFRGKRLASYLMAFMIDVCQQNKLKRLFAVVSATNVPQFKQMLSMGFVPVEALTHFAFKRPKASLKYVK